MTKPANHAQARAMMEHSEVIPTADWIVFKGDDRFEEARAFVQAWFTHD